MFIKTLPKDYPTLRIGLSYVFSVDDTGKPYISYINKMTIKKFRQWIKSSPFRCVYYKEVPLRKSLSFLAKWSLTKEYFVKMLVAVLNKPIEKT